MPDPEARAALAGRTRWPRRIAFAILLAAGAGYFGYLQLAGNLDTKSAQGVFDLMRQVNAEHGTTVLVVTHNHDLAGQCDRIVEIVDGRITSDRRAH